MPPLYSFLATYGRKESGQRSMYAGGKMSKMVIHCTRGFDFTGTS